MLEDGRAVFYESDGVQSSSFDNMTSAELDMKRNISEDKQKECKFYMFGTDNSFKILKRE